ncbi:YkgJ family cysteine cluster protein [Desulfovibrio sulfodismutans]|uniref:YkgJ family cysteine cluster protein n=1 Tax=Desulfolutivibrio sulfodismutans TaxID=63561 RepID=A0A7K3NNE8_9BACT|nr:YkgJ family cysteine cluster protein [Desulfolutivibrio sulfodismutans]NDY57353.1 YkgJ family cysteine cluster protein [Desulfolutivibrio sulfodismutans]QLA12466.1 YkgJ family cysteine cluster protein [Desulfolutivibrio sulfodismutans DSM 3696]
MKSSSPPPTCRRCGLCCRKGGPALHLEDLPLAVSGVVPHSALVTLRQGETVRDNVTGRLVTLHREMVRIRAFGASPVCPFFREPGDCLIHDHSPAECRALYCAAPQALMEMYQKDRATRRDLIPLASPQWELVQIHEERCPAGEAIRLCLAARNDPAAAADLAEMVRFDAAFRELCVEKAALTPDELELYFGRPLAEVIMPFERKRAMTNAMSD